MKFAPLVVYLLQDTPLEGLAMSAGDVEQFVSGLIFGLIQKNDLQKIQQCLSDADSIADKLTNVIAEFKAGDVADIIKAIGDIGGIIEGLPNDLQDCKDMQPDIQRIEKWGQIFTHPSQLISTITQQVLMHYADIMKDVSDITTDFSSQQWNAAGTAIGDLLIQILGKVPEKVLAELELIAEVEAELLQPEDLKITQWEWTDPTESNWTHQLIYD